MVENCNVYSRCCSLSVKYDREFSCCVEICTYEPILIVVGVCREESNRFLYKVFIGVEKIAFEVL